MEISPAHAAVFIVLVTACATPEDVNYVSHDSDTTGSGTASTWVEMDREQRLAYMNDIVLPTMKARFEAASPAPLAILECETCHGDDMVARDYVMPNRLPAVDAAKFPYSTSADPDEAAWGLFMEGEVVPAMAELLGQSAYDADTNPGGFYCFACHVAG